MNKVFIIKKLVVSEPYRLTITFGDNATLDVNLEDIMAQYKHLEPLRDFSLFKNASVGLAGLNVIWNDDIDLAGDNLRAEAVEQAGDISHERIWNWMHRHNLTLDAAAAALGISRRMLAYYRTGEKPIPKHIWLACLGWEYCERAGNNLKKAA